MEKDRNDLNPDQENQQEVSAEPLSGEVNFEQYIEDSLDDADMKDDDPMSEDEVEQVAEEQMNQEEGDEIRKTTREIMEIISQNELIEKAKRERINSILSRQEKVREKRTEILERLRQELEVVNKKRMLAKAALKKARTQKLDSSRINLIKKELYQAKEARRHCKKLISEEKKTLSNISQIIDLLETAR